MSPKNGFLLLGGNGCDNPASEHILRKTGVQLIIELSDAETKIFGITLKE